MTHVMLVRGLLLDPATVGPFAWTLIHFLWQGLALAALLWAALRIPRQSPPLRYLTACAILLLMIAAPAVTFWALRGQFDDPGPLTLPADLANLTRPATRPESRARAVTATAPPVAPQQARCTLPPLWASRVQRLLPWTVLIWLTIALILAARQAIGVLLLRRMLRRNTSPLRHGLERLGELPARLRIRRPVQFRESTLLEAPATVGTLRPLVLVPSSALKSLPPEQLDALVAHELAHIRRHDYLINLVQSVLESALAFHPAVWWVSNRVREEREHCCDELAAGAVGSRKAYASALKSMEQLRPSSAPALALSAAGGPLLRRIRRLATPLARDGSRAARAARAALLAPFITAAVLLLAAAQLIATSVNVEPPRGLNDLASLSSSIYQTLDVPDGAGDCLASLHRVLQTASSDGKSFDPAAVAEFVFNINRDPRASALVDAQLPFTGVDDRNGSERRPEWPYRTSFVRMRLGKQILDESRMLDAAANSRLARDYAHAALLLAAQESGLIGTAFVAKVMKHEDFPHLAQLSPRQLARVNRAIDDHRLILRVCGQESLRATYSLRVLAEYLQTPHSLDADDAAAARRDLADSLSVMLRVSRGRPDIQWTVAHYCWQARAVLDERDNDSHWREPLLAQANQTASPYLRRWLDDAFHAPVPPPQFGSSANDLHKQVHDWQRRGMIPRANPSAEYLETRSKNRDGFSRRVCSATASEAAPAGSSLQALTPASRSG